METIHHKYMREALNHVIILVYLTYDIFFKKLNTLKFGN